MQPTEQQHPPQAPAELRLERHYPVAPEKVWRAWTEPQALSAWFGMGRAGSVTEAEVDLRVGGRWRIVNTLAGQETHDVSGEYLEVVPHRRLAFTWAWHSTPDRVSRVSLDFVAHGSGTTLHFVHDRFFDRQARDNHERGWRPGLEQLEAYLRQDPGTQAR